VIKSIVGEIISIEFLCDKKYCKISKFDAKLYIECHGTHTFFIDKLEKIKKKILKYDSFPKGYTGLMNLGNTYISDIDAI
jgi:hypothetical protein